MTEKTDSTSQSFLTGFLTGAIVSGASFYLAFTKQGRKLTREILKYAEELSEKGEMGLRDLTESSDFDEVKVKTGKKIGSIVDKLKLELKDVKKGIDIKK